VVARLQQVDLAEFIAHEQTTDTHMTSTTTSPSIVDLEKLLHAQALVIQNVSQLTSSYQQVLASRNVTRNETTDKKRMHTNRQTTLEHVVVVSTMEFLVARSIQTKVKLQNRRTGFYFLV
jgi:ABC-type anion transport system duplicated permease subunit